MVLKPLPAHVLLCHISVLRPAEAPVLKEGHALRQQPVHVSNVEPQRALTAHTNRHSCMMCQQRSSSSTEQECILSNTASGYDVTVGQSSVPTAVTPSRMHSKP
jgi:hypothetical protein